MKEIRFDDGSYAYISNATYERLREAAPGIFDEIIIEVNDFEEGK